jgi:hypothetical protein
MEGRAQRAKAVDNASGEAEFGQASGAAPALALVPAQVGEDLLTGVAWEMISEREETARSVDQRLSRLPSFVCLLLIVVPEDAERDVGVFEANAGQKQASPELIVHRAVIVVIDATDVQGQLTRKEDLRLDQVTPLHARTPHGPDSKKVFDRMNTPAMRFRQ